MGVRDRATAAFIREFRQRYPDREFASDGYVRQLADNLLPGVTPDLFEADFRSGAGRELDTKARAVYSSAVLAVNTFAPWKADPATFPLLTEATSIRFEARCSSGLGGTPPHLDVLAKSQRSVAGVESKCLEYLTPTTPDFPDSYDALKPRLGASRWYQQIARLRADRGAYRYLDVAQLIKHFCGLSNSYLDLPKKIVYLFWEPANHTDWAECRAHREELLRFAEAVTGDEVEFLWSSYPELWATWGDQAAPPWGPGHVQNLRDRYCFTI